MSSRSTIHSMIPIWGAAIVLAAVLGACGADDPTVSATSPAQPVVTEVTVGAAPTITSISTPAPSTPAPTRPGPAGPIPGTGVPFVLEEGRVTVEHVPAGFAPHGSIHEGVGPDGQLVRALAFGDGSYVISFAIFSGLPVDQQLAGLPPPDVVDSALLPGRDVRIRRSIASDLGTEYCWSLDETTTFCMVTTLEDPSTIRKILAGVKVDER